MSVYAINTTGIVKNAEDYKYLMLVERDLSLMIESVKSIPDNIIKLRLYIQATSRRSEKYSDVPLDDNNYSLSKDTLYLSIDHRNPELKVFDIKTKKYVDPDKITGEELEKLKCII